MLEKEKHAKRMFDDNLDESELDTSEEIIEVDFSNSRSERTECIYF